MTSRIGPETRAMLAKAKPGQCVRCEEPAAFRTLVMLKDSDTEQLTGEAYEIEMCLACGADMLAMPSTEVLDDDGPRVGKA